MLLLTGMSFVGIAFVFVQVQNCRADWQSQRNELSNDVSKWIEKERKDILARISHLEGQVGAEFMKSIGPAKFKKGDMVEWPKMIIENKCVYKTIQLKGEIITFTEVLIGITPCYKYTILAGNDIIEKMENDLCLNTDYGF